MKEIMKLLFDDKGYMVVAIFYFAIYAVAAAMIQMKLRLNFWHSYMWYFKEYALPMTVLYSIGLMYALLWAIYTIKREIFSAEECEE